MSARKRMRLEDGSSSNVMPLEPSATINDLPSEVMKNIFSFVGKGSYYFIGPVSKDFCYNYITMDIIEDKFAHKMDYLQAIERNKITTAEAVISSFELAEYCFFNAPEKFQRRLVNRAIREAKVEVVEMGEAMGIDVVKNLSRYSKEIVEIVEKGNVDILKFIYGRHSNIYELEYAIIQTAAKNDQLEVLKWWNKHEMITESFYQSTLLNEAAKSGSLETMKWAKEVAGFNFQQESQLINFAAQSGNVELVKYLRSKEIPWHEETFCNAASSGNIVMLQYLLEKGCPHDDPEIYSRLIETVCSEKTLEMLQWLHEHNVSWNEKTCSVLAEKGNLKALKYVRSNSCAWNEQCVIGAIKSRNDDILNYCLENRCPMGNSDVCRFAMDDPDQDRALRKLKFLRSKGCPWDGQKCAYNAARHGNIKALKWMRAQGVVFEEETCRAAARQGHLETLKYLTSVGCPLCVLEHTFPAVKKSGIAIVEYCIENDFPCTDKLYYYAIEDIADSFPVIKLLQKNQYPLNSSACEGAAVYWDLKTLRWLKYKGCPWDESVCNWAVMNNEFDMLKFAHENGCSWTKETYAYCFSSEGLEKEYHSIPSIFDIQCSKEIFKYIQKHKCPRPDPSDWNLIIAL
ncbi:hypothetical protein CTEN210_09806 [Chaetoceros tenuissimus]|uniref:Uncharacterized protein n=1 Tax=Chaetoceros tenuissimus TaxID=426638 RepID=A0AAD3H7K4_9STRA|nr:hypothetical protein CTEN210_09806 [Chaetoceros tenuissimus]